MIGIWLTSFKISEQLTKRINNVTVYQKFQNVRKNMIYTFNELLLMNDDEWCTSHTISTTIINHKLGD